MAEQLALASDATGIPKSTICRMALARILQDMASTGVAVEMAKFRAHYFADAFEDEAVS
jgi:hypothetical protein